MRKFELNIVGLMPSLAQSRNYAVILKEAQGKRRLPIVIGGYEAQAIAVAMENMVPNRPLTHDLFRSTLETFDIQLKEVLISDLSDGVFYALLICIKDDNIIEVDARASDALALAVRFRCPIYTFDFILEEAGAEFEENYEGEFEEKEEIKGLSKPAGDTLKSYSEDALNHLLKEVIDNEDYERAAKIRDEINRRKQSKEGQV